jgi:hypothetical protein
MDLYLLALLLGFLGLTIMAFAGFVGHGHDAAGAHLPGGGHADALGHGGAVAGHLHGDAIGHLGHAGGHAADAVGHAGHASGHLDHGLGHAHDVHGHDASAPAHGVHQHGHGQEAGARSLAGTLLSWLSPRVLFGVLVGVGATGLLLRGRLPALIVALAALLAGVAFEAGVLGPVWSVLFRFASAPARTLVDTWMDVATATTAFDATGDGLVRLELNGELRQILARLRPEDRQAGVRVHMGDQLRVEEVDPVRNECVVSWLGRGEAAE